MVLDLRRWFGMGGVGPHENPRAYVWEMRLHWAVALMAVPAVKLPKCVRSCSAMT